jgi:hypothetical protein
LRDEDDAPVVGDGGEHVERRGQEGGESRSVGDRDRRKGHDRGRSDANRDLDRAAGEGDAGLGHGRREKPVEVPRPLRSEAQGRDRVRIVRSRSERDTVAGDAR